MRAACGVRRRRRRTACTVVRISLGSKPAERTQDADANCGPPLREASARRRLRRRLQAAVLSHGLSGRNLRRGATCGPSPGRSCGPPMSVTSSHAACSTASRRMIHDLSDRSLRRDATVTKRAFAGRSCGPPMACAIAFGHAIAGSAHSRADGRAIKESSPPLAKGRLRAAAHMCEFADGTKAIRRCRPPHRAADGTRRSNGVTRQDGITRSIDCSVFLFGQRHKSPSREPRYGFRLFAMIFKTSLAELYRA